MTSTRPRVVLFDPIPWAGIEWSYDDERRLLGPLGVELVEPVDHAERDRAITTADIVVVSSVESLSATHIASLDRCVGILCYSAGKDAVDTSAAEARGIPVDNVRPGTADVADHAMALLLAVERMLVPMHEATSVHVWDMSRYPTLQAIRRLEGQVLGIVGAGAIGLAVAARARAFGFTTIATYHHPPTDPDADLPHFALGDLFAAADAVVLTASLTDSSRGMVDRDVLSRARPGTILVNVGRGGLIVEDHLADALDSGTIRAAALDVREPEPPDPNNDRLTGRPDVIQTPHMAGMSMEARADIHRLAAEAIEEMLRNAGRL